MKKSSLQQSLLITGVLALLYGCNCDSQTTQSAQKTYGPLGVIQCKKKSYTPISPASLDLNLKEIGLPATTQQPGDRLYVGWGLVTVHNE